MTHQWGGGSNDLQMTPNLFWELFKTFLHEMKSPYLKLKKSGEVKHPNAYLFPIIFQSWNLQEITGEAAKLTGFF